MTNSNPGLLPDKIINSEQLYTEATSLVLSSAQRELMIFDQDLSHGGFASLEKFNIIKNFVSAYPASDLTIILQSPAFLKNRCPRLLNLLEVYGHKMHVHLTNTSVKHIKDCFIVADKTHYIRRIHIDQPRFRYSLNDRQNAEVLNNRFSELMETIEDAIVMRPLGL